MKVSSKVGNPAQDAQAAKVAKPNSDPAASAKRKSLASEAFGTNSARVDVSQRALEIKKAKDLASPKDSDIDEAKVARLQALIDKGEYKVDSAKVADKLVDEHLLTGE
jgi:flagellar biosynthesis anti-sigma factor FlgM